jgi:uncharacterized protein (DUF1330 family)
MPKGYWISAYHSISDPEKLAAYAALAGPALEGAGGRFLARAAEAIPREAGKNARTVLIQFDSVEAATAAYNSPAYQEALAALGDGAVRDIRIIEGVD